ncbi:MAG: DUF1844 domain-containing protein [Candidatus Binatia bacterium]
MSDEAEKGDPRGFKVQDRRRFSETGDVRPEYQDSGADRTPPPGAAASQAAAPGAAPQRERPAGPPVALSFSTFVISLSTQALAQLGEIPDPLNNQTAVDLGAAKQLIDILGILKEKTKGNLDQAESGLLDSILYDLRIKYVERMRAHSQKT